MMMGKSRQIAGMLKNVKARTLFFITGGIITFGLFLAIVGLRGGDESATVNQASANLPTAPRITDEPDVLAQRTVSQQRARLIKEANDQAVWNAARQGGSALVTPFNQTVSLQGQDIQQYQQQQIQQQLYQLIRKAQQTKPAMSNTQPARVASVNANVVNPRLPTHVTSEDDNSILGFESNPSAMTAEVKQLLSSWNPTAQQYVEVPNKAANQQGNVTGQAASGNLLSVKAPLLQAGTILFGVLQTQVNTDQPSPVMATIETGPYKGAKLLGSLQAAGKHAKGVVLQFNTMTLPNYKNSISINAVAIDPNTARTALASDVDHHYLLRYWSIIFCAIYVRAWTGSGIIRADNRQ